MDLKSYAGDIRFSDASITMRLDTGNLKPGYSEERNALEKQFRKDVFRRVIQQMNRLGWSLTIPEDMTKNYGPSFAREYRNCVKGDLLGELCFSGHRIELRMWQNVNVPPEKRSDGNGKYLFDKEMHMPYLLLLEMKRTRNRLKHYLENVCSFKFVHGQWCRSTKLIGVRGLTAYEWIQKDYQSCWHYKPELGRRDGDEYAGNSTSAEGELLSHGQPVWFYDPQGRLCRGTAYYNINNMWWVISGLYGLRNIYCGEIYVNQPADPRFKNNGYLRKQRLTNLLQNAVKYEDFEKAIIFRDLMKLDEVRHASE